MAIPQIFLNSITNRKTNNSSFISKNKVNLNNVIYSNELVRDFKLLRRCNSLESIDIFINNRFNEIKLLDSFIETDSIKLKRSFSLEYLDCYSLEGISDVFKKIGTWILDKINKVIAFIVGIIKWIVEKMKGKVSKSIIEVANSFDPNKYTHFDVEIKASPLLDDKNKTFENLIIPVSQHISNFLSVSNLKIPKSIKDIYDNQMSIGDFEKYGEDIFEVSLNWEKLFVEDFCSHYYVDTITPKTLSIRDYLGSENTISKKEPIAVLTTLKKATTNVETDIKHLKEMIRKEEQEAKEFKRLLEEEKKKINDEMNSEKYTNSDKTRKLNNVIRVMSQKITILANFLKYHSEIYKIRLEILKELAKALLLAQGYSPKSTITD